MYRIVRIYFRPGMIPYSRRTIRRGLTLEEAQTHCSNPETSSRTCKGKVGRTRTRKCGPWFDAYDIDN